MNILLLLCKQADLKVCSSINIVRVCKRSEEICYNSLTPYLDDTSGNTVMVSGHLEYRMQRIHRIQRIWRYRDGGVRGAPPPSARWRRLGPLRRCNNRAIITNDAIGALLVNSPQEGVRCGQANRLV